MACFEVYFLPVQNAKKKEQKQRRLAARRASEGDKDNVIPATPEEDPKSDFNSKGHLHNDSGVSFVQESEKPANNRRNGRKKPPARRKPEGANSAAVNSNNDLIFELDF